MQEEPIVLDDRYEVLQTLGSGGMGMVYRVRDRRLQRQLALKTIRPSRMLSESAISRFIEEAQISSQLQHPAIVPIHDIGRLADGRMYYTMAWVRGQTLSDALAQRRLDTRHGRSLLPWLRIVRDAAVAVAHAHQRRVIHRDLKPSNLIVDPQGKVFVIDWGLARIVSSPATSQPEASGDVVVAPSSISPTRTRITSIRQEQRDDQPNAIDPDESVPDDLIPDNWFDEDSASIGSDMHTTPGSVIGTVTYMAPEQARGEIDQIDTRSDVFSLGAILGEILTGRPPYDVPDPKQKLVMAMAGDLSACHRRIRQCDAPADVKSIARMCLQANREDRPRHAGELAQLLDKRLAGRATRRQWLIAGTVATSAASLTAVTLLNESTDDITKASDGSGASESRRALDASNRKDGTTAEQILSALDQPLLKLAQAPLPSAQPKNLSYRQIFASLGAPLDSDSETNDWIDAWPPPTRDVILDAILRWKWLPTETSLTAPPSEQLVASAMARLNGDSSRKIYEAIAEVNYEKVCEAISKSSDPIAMLAGIDCVSQRPPEWDINQVQRAVSWQSCVIESISSVHRQKAIVADDGWITLPDSGAFFDQLTILYANPYAGHAALKIEIDMEPQRVQSLTDIVDFVWEPKHYRVKPKVPFRVADIFTSAPSQIGLHPISAIDENPSTVWRIDHTRVGGPVTAILVPNPDHNGSFMDGGSLKIHSGEPDAVRRTTISRLRFMAGSGSPTHLFDPEPILIDVLKRLINRFREEPRMLTILALRIASIRKPDLAAAMTLAFEAVRLAKPTDQSMSVLVAVMLPFRFPPNHPAIDRLMGSIDQIASAPTRSFYRAQLAEHWQQRADELRGAGRRRGVEELEAAVENLSSEK